MTQEWLTLNMTTAPPRALGTRQEVCAFNPGRHQRWFGMMGWVLLSLMTVGMLAITARAASTLAEFDDQAAMEAAEVGLNSEANFPWYDAELDGLKRIEVSKQPSPPEAKNWVVATQPKKKPASNRVPWSFSFSELFALLLQVLAWSVLAAALGFGCYFAMQSLLNTDLDLSAHGGSDEDRLLTDEERMENLPFDIRRPHSDLLAEARRYYEAGAFREAIIYLFSYQLVQLDKQHWIRLAKGKTNRQYLRELRQQVELSGVFRQSMVTFEDVFFGHHAIDRDRFESCWTRLDEFHDMLRPDGA